MRSVVVQVLCRWCFGLSAFIVTCAVLSLASPALARAGPIAVSFPSFGDPASTRVTGQLFPTRGTAPFPAVVLLHGCDGPEPYHRAYGAWLAEHGFEALLVDSYGPRGVTETCGNSVRLRREQAMDALGALELLRARPEVDAARVAVMGWSGGGGATLVAIAPRFIRRRQPTGGGFSAAVVLYPPCDEVGRVDAIDAPLLLLLGGADDWHPAKGCEDLAATYASNHGSVSVHIYAGDTHAFDDPVARGHREVHGRTVTLRYDAAAAADARDRILTFLDSQLGRPAAPAR